MSEPRRLIDMPSTTDARRALTAGIGLAPPNGVEQRVWGGLCVTLGATAAATALVSSTSSLAATGVAGGSTGGGAAAAATTLLSGSSTAALGATAGSGATLGAGAIGTSVGGATLGIGSTGLVLALKFVAVGLGAGILLGGPTLLSNAVQAFAPSTELPAASGTTTSASKTQPSAALPDAAPPVTGDADTAAVAATTSGAQGLTDLVESAALHENDTALGRAAVKPSPFGGVAARKSLSPPAAPAAKPKLSGSVADLRGSDESALVLAARGALQRGEAAAALKLLTQANAAPGGGLEQERATLTIEALVQLGSREEALRRANAFLERHPESPYAAKLRALLR